MSLVNGRGKFIGRFFYRWWLKFPQQFFHEWICKKWRLLDVSSDFLEKVWVVSNVCLMGNVYPKRCFLGVEADMYFGFNGLFQFWSQTTNPLTFRFQWPHCARYVYQSEHVQIPQLEGLRSYRSGSLFELIVRGVVWEFQVVCFPHLFFFRMGSSYHSRGKRLRYQKPEGKMDVAAAAAETDDSKKRRKRRTVAAPWNCFRYVPVIEYIY